MNGRKLSRPTDYDLEIKMDYSPYMIIGIMLTFISSLFVIPMNLIYLSNGWFSFETQRDTIQSVMILSGLIMPALTGLWTVILYRKNKGVDNEIQH
jgi:predicted RND superfamily exporter protein